MPTERADPAQGTPFVRRFQDHVTLIEYDGRPVVVAREFGALLGYADDGKSLQALISGDWAEEFIADVDFIVLKNGRLAAFKRLCAELGLDLVDKRAPSLLLLTESGIQLVLARTEKPEGKTFRRWLVSEVIPAYNATKALPGPAPSRPPARVKSREANALPGPLPLPKGMPKEEAAVSEAKRAGLAAYEALEPAIRRRGLIASALRSLRRGQSAWLCQRLTERYGLSPPEFRHDGRGEGAEYAPMWEARAQAWWLVERIPDADLVEVTRLVDEAATQPDVSAFEDLWERLVADLRKLSPSEVRTLASIVRRLNGRHDAHHAALELVDTLVTRGPKAVCEAREWCQRLWRLEQG